jgi:chitinase
VRGLFYHFHTCSADRLRPPDFYYLEGIDPVAMQCYVDFFNFMAYDLHGPWEAWDQGAIIRSQSSIVDIGNDMLPLWFDGLDPSKINLGIPYYGRGYTLSNNSCTGIGCPYSDVSKPGNCTGSPGVLSLREITRTIKELNLTAELLPDEMVKQIVWDGNQWMGYDDDETIALKMKWADEHCLGGTAVWSIDFNSGPGR